MIAVMRDRWQGNLMLGLLLLLVLASCATPAAIPPKPGMPTSSAGSSRLAGKTAGTRLITIPFTIQVGAFSTTARAARYAERLNAHGLDAYYFIDSDGLCKVRFERFLTKEDALFRAAELQAKGYIDAYYVVQPSAGTYSADPLIALRGSIVSTARRFIGTPYRWGGASAEYGFDCSGLTMTVYRLNGLELPRNSRAQFDAGEYTSSNALQPGDLVFFATGRRGRVSHVGIYTGKGRFIHASGTGKTIRTDALHKDYFRKRYMGARRYF